MDNKTLVMGTLATDAFTVVNKRVLRHFKGDGTLAILVCELISIYKYMLSHNSVDELDSFPLPIAFLKKNMNLSEFKQKRVLTELQSKGLVIVTRVGMPASRRVALNFDAIASILDEEVEKELKQKEKSSKFYSKLNKACNAQILLSKDFHDNLDNIKEPLSGCMYLATQHVRQHSKEVIAWSPSTLGAVKSILTHYHKYETFDYGRFMDLLKATPVKEFPSFISDLFNRHKTIAERSPETREYRY
jgi:hypothetical protein